MLREAAAWQHETVPGIAMILDDEAVLETNGDGRFMNEAVMWEWKTGLARSGVPLRIHLLEDLTLPNFPPHRVFYFPNLFRIDAARRKILEEKVLRNGNVVVWGPGTGISDGTTISAVQATAVTGFAFDFLPGQRDSKDGVVSGEAAVGAVVDALVAEVQRGEEADRLAEALAGEGLGPAAKLLESGRGGG